MYVWMYVWMDVCIYVYIYMDVHEDTWICVTVSLRRSGLPSAIGPSIIQQRTVTRLSLDAFGYLLFLFLDLPRLAVEFAQSLVLSP
jgi:hypothetical protein